MDNLIHFFYFDFIQAHVSLFSKVFGKLVNVNILVVFQYLLFKYTLMQNNA